MQFAKFFCLTKGLLHKTTGYEVGIARLKLTLQIPIISFKIYGDLEPMVKQLWGEYVVHKVELILYYEWATKLLSQFEKLEFGGLQMDKPMRE